MTNLQNLNDIPVYIISFNRLSDLKKLVHFLEQEGLKNIHIIDNASSFPPLLDYYKSLPYPIHRMDKNYGHMVFYEADEFKDVRENQYYILTDPDILPIVEITDLNNLYLKEGRMNVVPMKRGNAWLDAGTPDSLMDASQFIQIKYYGCI